VRFDEPEVCPGHVVISTASVRDNGTGMAYLPPEFPFVPGFGLLERFVRWARKLPRLHYVG
jgi:uridine phosphorylase